MSKLTSARMATLLVATLPLACGGDSTSSSPKQGDSNGRSAASGDGEGFEFDPSQLTTPRKNEENLSAGSSPPDLKPSEIVDRFLSEQLPTLLDESSKAWFVVPTEDSANPSEWLVEVQRDSKNDLVRVMGFCVDNGQLTGWYTSVTMSESASEIDGMEPAVVVHDDAGEPSLRFPDQGKLPLITKIGYGLMEAVTSTMKASEEKAELGDAIATKLDRAVIPVGG